MVEFALSKAHCLPKDFKENIKSLLGAICKIEGESAGEINRITAEMTYNLKECLKSLEP